MALAMTLADGQVPPLAAMLAGAVAGVVVTLLGTDPALTAELAADLTAGEALPAVVP